MTLLEWGALGELIGGIAIIGSLLYVGVQVKNSARATRSATANDASVHMQAWYLEIGSDAEKSAVFLNGMANPDSLSREEFFQFTMMTHAAFLAFQNAYYLSQEGTLDPGIQRSITNIILGVKDQPGLHVYWNERKQLLYPGFVEFVDDLLASDEHMPLTSYRSPEKSE